MTHRMDTGKSFGLTLQTADLEEVLKTEDTGATKAIVRNIRRDKGQSKLVRNKGDGLPRRLRWVATN